MDNYELGVYIEKVLEVIKFFFNIVMLCFIEQVEVVVEVFSLDLVQFMDENEFIDVFCLVYDGIWDIWKVVLMIRIFEELDDFDFEIEDFDVRSRISVQIEDDQLIVGQSVWVIMVQFFQE